MSARKKRITFEKLDVNPNYAGEDEVSESENNEDIAPKKHRTYAFRPAKRPESEGNGKVYAVGFMPVFVLFDYARRNPLTNDAHVEVLG